MRTLLRIVIATAVTVMALTGFPMPAHASGPEITSPAGPVLDPHTQPFFWVRGAGCPASSPVSLEIWDTMNPSGRWQQTLSASTQGTFAALKIIDPTWPAGAKIGIFVSCTPTVDRNAPAGLRAEPRFVYVSLPSPSAAVVAPPRAPYGSAPVATVLTDAVPGSTTLTANGASLSPDPRLSSRGRAVFHLPRSLPVGIQRLVARWDPEAPGSVATAEATMEVTRATPTVSLTARSGQIARKRPLTLRASLLPLSSAPRTGWLIIKDGRRELKRLSLLSVDNGKRTVTVRLSQVGRHRLTAMFLGNAVLAEARSPALTVRVRR